MINSPRVVYFESPDNCGKTTLVREVENSLLELGLSVRTIAQPASSQLGRAIYDMHHQYGKISMMPFSRQLLHVASHLQFYSEYERTTDVLLCDRSFFSCMAYAHAYPSSEHRRDFEVRAIFDLETYFLPHDLYPDITVYLTNKPHSEDANQQFENYEKVSAAYLELWKLPYVKTFLERRHVYAVNNSFGKLEATVKMVTEMITKIS